MIYIVGPVTGHEDDNRPAFEEARRALGPACIRLRTVQIPHDIVRPGATWEEAMRSCIRTLTYADELVYLPGSQDSRGAKLEMRVARALGIPVYSLEQYLKRLGRERK